MVIVLLHRIRSRTAIVLHNPVIRQTRQELVSLINRRVELDNMRRLARVEPVDTLSRLRIPQLDPPVERARKELGSVPVKRQVGDSLRMARIRPQQLPIAIHIEDLDGTIRTSRQTQMTRLGKQLQRRDRLAGMVPPRMHVLLGNKVRDAPDILGETDIQILRDVHVRPAQIIELLGTVERRRLLAQLFDLFPPRQVLRRRLDHRPALYHLIFFLLLFFNNLILLITPQLLLIHLLIFLLLVPCPRPDVGPIAIRNRRASFPLSLLPQLRSCRLLRGAAQLFARGTAAALDGAVLGAEGVFADVGLGRGAGQDVPPLGADGGRSRIGFVAEGVGGPEARSA